MMADKAKNKSKKGYVAGGVGILGSLYAAFWSKEKSNAEEDKSTNKEKIKKAAVKNWKKEIKNPEAFDDKELPEDIKNVLDKNQKLLYSFMIGDDKIYTPSFLPNYVVKRAENEQRDRIVGAKAMTAVIDQYHLMHLFVPKKHHYTTPDGKKYIIAQLVQRSKEPITKEELKQLIFLSSKLIWIDGHSNNFLKTPRGLAVIDTDSYFMDKKKLHHYITVQGLSNKQWFKLKKLFLPDPSKKIDLYKKNYIIKRLDHSFLTPEARKYLEKRKNSTERKIKEIQERKLQKWVEDKKIEQHKRINRLIENLVLQYIDFPPKQVEE